MSSGFWACYSADETYHKDMWSLFAAAAARTSRLRMGPEVAGVILKDPTLAAQQVATLDLADNMLGAIAADAEPARRAARIVAAFYLSSMPSELLQRNGVDPADVESAVNAFKAGDVERALELTPPAVGEALSVAGTAQDWIDKIERDFLPAGFRHLLVTFADPFLVESWAGITIEGLPSLEDQIRLFHAEVMPAFAKATTLAR